MKTTKTVEIEICDDCGDERAKHDGFICAGCLAETHKCCQNSYAVTVTLAKPTPTNQSSIRVGLDARRMRHFSIERPAHFQFYGQFCDGCSARIEDILSAGGLVKSKPKVDMTSFA